MEVFVNKFEENIYEEIKNELVQSVIDKKLDNYYTNKNQLTHYYNVGKKIIEAQGGEKKAKYGDSLIKKISEKLTKEIGHGYSTRSLKLMRKFYIFQKGQSLPALLTWSHYVELLSLNNQNEINYYIDIAIKEKIGYRQLHKKIKDKEYQRLGDKTKNKLINKEKLNIYDNIKNPIYINTYDKNLDKEKIGEKLLKSFILKDLDNF